MGITGGLVKNVFSKNRSAAGHESSAGNNGGDKRRWNAVRSYFCGDEFNSVIAEEDSASLKSSAIVTPQAVTESNFNSVPAEADSVSVKSSEATVTQPTLELSEGITPIAKHNSAANLFRREDAAIVIQSAFRNFLTRSRIEATEMNDDKHKLVEGTESPCRNSVGTSIEVQTGNSVEVLSLKEEHVAVPFHRTKKLRTQVLKIKEDWDDSTVSSNISEMRIRSRLEATNRRERALAYAFAQQLRICSKKQQQPIILEGTEQPNMSWSWLERWMATRIPDNKPLPGVNSETENLAETVRKRFFDVALEEKESCGSNEVSVQFDSLSLTSTNEKRGFKNRAKATRTISRRKTVPKS